jgi:sirohydrochlorin ferrochelatase
MYAERHAVTVVTDGSGNAVAFSPVVTGRVLAIRYVKAGSGAYDDGVDFAITAEATGENLWTESNVNAAKSVYPRAGVHDLAGAARTYDGTNAVAEPVALAQDRVKISIAQGGAAKTGAFHILIG